MIGIFYVLKAANVKLPKASLDAVDVMKLAGGIVGGALVKDYAGLQIMDEWYNEWYNKTFYRPQGQ